MPTVNDPPTTPDGARRSRPAQLVSKVWRPLGIGLIVLVIVNLLGFDPIGTLRDELFGVKERPEAADSTLLAIRRTAELRAATGEFSVPVYFGTEQDGVVHDILPDAFDANSGIAIYQGSVDAFVDLRGLTADDLDLNRSDRSITIRVPQPRLSEPNIDESKSKVVTQDRGLLTRFGEFFSSTPLRGKDDLDQTAVAALGKAAEESRLRATARDNARDVLTALVRKLGYEDVTVTFERERP